MGKLHSVGLFFLKMFQGGGSRSEAQNLGLSSIWISSIMYDNELVFADASFNINWFLTSKQSHKKFNAKDDTRYLEMEIQRCLGGTVS